MYPAYLNNIEECELHIRRSISAWGRMGVGILLLIRNDGELSEDEKKYTKHTKN